MHTKEFDFLDKGFNYYAPMSMILIYILIYYIGIDSIKTDSENNFYKF